MISNEIGLENLVITTDQTSPGVIDGVYYPGDDGEPMAETGIHVNAIFELRELLLDLAASRIAPHRIVDAIVKIKVDQVLELRARRREQLLADPDVVLHRAADIDEQQQLDGVVTLGHQLQV